MAGHMIERREKWRMTRRLWWLAAFCCKHRLPWQWLFDLGAAARVSQYRIDGGAWESHKSAPHAYAVGLFRGEPIPWEKG